MLVLLVLEGAAAAVAAAGASLCYWPPPNCGPYCRSCGGPGHQACGPPLSGPQFHIRDQTCGTQDPNAPIYDPLHGVYHMFWQAHTARPCAGDFKAAPSIGHAVSRDLVKWARVEVAIWNGGQGTYDADAIYSCSATLVDGVPTIVYPGLCESSSWADGLCQTWPGKGTTMNIATPANRSDNPLSRGEWVKFGQNPVANRTTDAPTTAWRTADGEYRLATTDSWIWSRCAR
jgi:sucrose-6-phosphate hydrolase SacC (GH32 family)